MEEMKEGEHVGRGSVNGGDEGGGTWSMCFVYVYEIVQ
jgi:hypothetical protein